MRILLPTQTTPPKIVPLFASAVPAGFPSPADDYVQARLSLDEHLVPHQASTFFVRARGDSMVGAGIFDGDLLVVDKSLTAQHNSIVIAVVDGALTVKRLIKRGSIVILHPENPHHSDITFAGEQELIIWGVVTATIKQFVCSR